MWFRHVSQDLSAYCQGQLSAEAAGRITNHLHACRQCRKDYQEIQRGIYLAEHLSPVAAPAGLWTEIEMSLAGGKEAQAFPSGQRASRWSRRAQQALAAMVVMAALGALVLRYYLAHPQFQGHQVNLAPYLDSVEKSSGASASVAIASAPSGFKESDSLTALAAAKVAHAAARPPLPGYHLAGQRILVLDGRQAVQLVYRETSDAFTVFVAPDATPFSFGNRGTIATQLHGIACRAVDCPRTSVFWFGANGFHCVLVSKSRSTEQLAAIVEYFTSAHNSLRQP